MKTGTIIDFVCIDGLQNRNLNHGDYVHFLTHVSRSAKRFEIPKGVNTIYTSGINLWYLVNYLMLPEDKFVGIPYQEKTKVIFKGNEVTFEFFPSYYSPGSIMIFLTGSFGSVLYNGYSRFYPELLPESLKPFWFQGENGVLDKLYLDGRYYHNKIDFPSREDVTRAACAMLMKYPLHTILIPMKPIGYEIPLINISQCLNEKIVVSEEQFALLNEIDHHIQTSSDSEGSKFFTTNPRESRIRAIDMKDVTLSKMRNREKRERSIVVVFSNEALVRNEADLDELKTLNVHFFQYSDHCSYSEVKTLSETFRAKEIVFIEKTIRAPIDEGQSTSSAAWMLPLSDVKLILDTKNKGLKPPEPEDFFWDDSESS